MKRRNFLGMYCNPHQKRIYRGFFHFLMWQFGFYNDPHPPPPLPEDFRFPNPEKAVDPTKPQVVWINHSTYWIKFAGKSILTDPIWGERCSPFKFFGPKRHHIPSHTLEELKEIDYVVISHNHYDHMDYKTILELHRLYPKITWVVPKGLKKWILRKLNDPDHIIELDWWEKKQSGEFTFSAVPAQHFSGRGLFDRNRSLWMGCIVSHGDKKLYFAGDTGYNHSDFKEIGEKFGPIDLSLLPIGVYFPRKFMRAVHIHPEESLAIHQDVKSKLSIGGHWGTFKLSSDSITRPPYDLYLALQRKELSCQQFRVLRHGQSINW